MRNTHAVMGAHFANPARSGPGRRRQAGIVSIALGVGLLAFAFLDSDGTPIRTTTPTVPPSSEPTVLGVTIAPEPTAPTAGPAEPVVGDLVPEAPATTAPSSSPRATSTTRPPSTTTTEAPVLIPPTVVTNTTTTTEAPTTTTSESTTTTVGEPPG